MSLTDFPALVDTFPVINAGAGDLLNTAGKAHDALENKHSEAVQALQRVTVGPTFVNVRGFGAIGDGSDESTEVAAAYADAPDGAIMVFPTGLYGVASATVQLLSSRRMQGDGMYASWIKPLTNTTAAAIDINITGGGPSPRTQYGPQVKGIGIDLSAAPLATGFKLRGNTAWAHLDDVLVNGGAISLDSQAPNCKVSNFKFLNPSTTFVKAIEAGLELRLSDGILEVSPAVTVPTLMDISVLTGGGKGAVYLRDITCNNTGTVTVGIVVACPNGSTASLPLRCFNVTLDNLSGPGFDLRNVTDCQIIGGWVNSAAGTTNGAIRFYGGGGHTLIGIQQLNGGSAGGCTYDWAGGAPAGITLIGNTPATGPVHRMTVVPASLNARDNTNIAAVLSDITTNPEGLRLATASRDWTPQVQAQPHYIRESGVKPPAGIAILVAGLVTVAHASVTANTRVRVWRERPLGTTGQLYSTVTDNIVGTSFKIRSDNAADVSWVYWEMYEQA